MHAAPAIKSHRETIKQSTIRTGDIAIHRGLATHGLLEIWPETFSLSWLSLLIPVCKVPVGTGWHREASGCYSHPHPGSHRDCDIPELPR